MILAIDQGTTSSRAIVFDNDMSVAAIAQKEFTQHYPKPSWVEHDANEIWESVLEVTQSVLERVAGGIDGIKAVGITNQRETAVVWNRESGEPIAPAIVWQSRQTTDICNQLVADGHAKLIQQKTGLVIDAYFSASKVQWLLDNVDGARALAEAGKLCFGTIDSWLIWKLSKGAVHTTDYTNASRTMLYNINDLKWDQELLDMFTVPGDMLPSVCDSSDDIAEVDGSFFGKSIPIAGIAGDQQAALFGQACFQVGQAKNTYGTGCFLLMNTGGKPVSSQSNLLSTIAWSINGKVEYALEGSVFIAGAAIQWLRDELKIIGDSSESEELALELQSNEGVYLVPAFVGLGAPYWDSDARGAVFGLTRGSNRSHFARAALESLAYQTKDIVDCMQADSGVSLKSLRVDGGVANNQFLMQFQSDMLGVPVEQPANKECTALGAALLAGLAVGFWNSKEEIAEFLTFESQFEPVMESNQSDVYYGGWKKAVAAARQFSNC